MTALKEALHAAGVKSPRERLHEIALKAMVKHADNTFATCDAIWAEVQKHRDLMVCLFEHGWRREVSALMHRVRNDVAYHSSTNTLTRPIERKAAKVVEMIRAEERREEAERRAEERAWQAERDREHEEYLAQWRKTRIGTLVIGEKPIWENSAGTVRAWLQTEKRRWHGSGLAADREATLAHG